MQLRPESLHYHIRWSGKDILDWESFGTRMEAELRAKELVRRDETFVIEERGQECPRCRYAFKLKTDHQTQVFQYPWQEAVSDAFTESHPELVAWKVNVAQRAISPRLCEQVPTDLDEKVAIREALHSLQALLPEPKKECDPKHHSARKKATA
jgi:hypothetical protein